MVRKSMERRLTLRDIYKVILTAQEEMRTNLKVEAKVKRKKRGRMKKLREKTKERQKSCKKLKKPNKFKTETNRKYQEEVVRALSV